jgi:hypothetical protein
MSKRRSRERGVGECGSLGEQGPGGRGEGVGVRGVGLSTMVEEVSDATRGE